jgi:hypothetical protein
MLIGARAEDGLMMGKLAAYAVELNCDLIGCASRKLDEVDGDEPDGSEGRVGGVGAGLEGVSDAMLLYAMMSRQS